MDDYKKIQGYSEQNIILIKALIDITSAYLLSNQPKTILEKTIFRIAQDALYESGRI